MDDWPFADARNVAAFTVRSVWDDKRPIVYVYHDDDGAWQFHPGRKVHENEACVVALEEIVALDSSVALVADLPLGWCAWRTSPQAPWHREQVTDRGGAMLGPRGPE